MIDISQKRYVSSYPNATVRNHLHHLVRTADLEVCACCVNSELEEAFVDEEGKGKGIDDGVICDDVHVQIGDLEGVNINKKTGLVKTDIELMFKSDEEIYIVKDVLRKSYFLPAPRSKLLVHLQSKYCAISLSCSTNSLIISILHSTYISLMYF